MSETMRRPSTSTTLSVVASAVAVTSLFFSMNTYWAVQRPYIGVVDVEYAFIDSPKPALHWSLIVKNVGALPGQAIIDAHAAAVAMGTSTRPLPELLRGGDSKVLIMPGQTVTVTRTLFDENAWPDVVKHVRSGQAVLTDTIRMSYQGGGVIWKSSFDYTAVFRFNATSTPPRFLTVSAEGD